MTSLALLLIGFSIFAAITLALTHFRRENYQDHPLPRLMGLVLLLALASLQIAHFVWLYLDMAWVTTIPYRMMLFAVAPAFFLFSHPLLKAQCESYLKPAYLWHAVPILISPVLPEKLALPLAFVVGAVYLLFLARSLYTLRMARANFRVELVLLGAVFLIAIGVSVIGLAQAVLPEKLFFSLYAIAIGSAFLLVQIALGLRPQLSRDVSEAVQTAYASSTLLNIDCEAALAKLDLLMRDERIYQDAELNLTRLAERLELSSHQLSELMNARLGKSFSRYLREQRVAAAQLMLCEQLSASVLSVGLSVGFTSQSNFYDAFREIDGMTPGQYRKLNTNRKVI